MASRKKSDWDNSVYALAERLHCFADDIRHRMTLREFIGWHEYYNKQDAPVDLTEMSKEDVMRMFG